MNETRERVREIALEVAQQVNGENIGSITSGIFFELPLCINGRDVIVRFRCFLNDLRFELFGVFENSNTRAPELTEYRNHETVTQQVRRLNSLFNNGLRRGGFHNRELLRRNLRGN
jgi:hypothetical protein